MKRRSSTKRELLKNSKPLKQQLFRKFSRSKKVSESYCLESTISRAKKATKGSKKRVRRPGFPFNNTFNESISISKLGENSTNYLALGGHRRKLSYGNSGKMKTAKNNSSIRYKSKENYRKIVNRYKRSKSISGGKKIEAPFTNKLHTDVFRLKEKQSEKIGILMKNYKEKKYEEAIDLGQTILNSDPNNSDVLYISGLSSSMVEKHSLTIKHFEKLCKFYPKFKKNVYLFLSIAHKKIGDFEEGIRVLDKGIKNFGPFYEAYVKIKITFFRFIKGNYY